MKINNTIMKNNRISSFILVYLFLFFHSSSFGQSNIENYLEEITTLKSFSGSIIVSVKDEIIIHKGFGYADYENEIPNSKESVHRIGSLTKQMTAMGILKLFNSSDSLSINHTIDKYIPNLPPSWRQVTVFQLLNHTSGIPNHFGDLDAVPVEDTYKEIEKVIKKEQSSVLNNNPGEAYNYSNFGYIILGRIIEIVSGENYFDYLTKVIFEPMEMNNTYYDDPRVIIKGRSEGYTISNGDRMNDALKDPAGYSAGGILSTTEDLLKWYKSFCSNIILNKSQRQLMFTPNKGDYGLGWQIVEKNGRKMYNHNGGTHGYNSRIVFYPEEDVFIAILGNNEDVRASAIACDIEGLIFNKKGHDLALPFEFKKADLKNFVGIYESKSGTKRSLYFKDNKLFYVNGNSEFELSPLSQNSFCFKQYEDYRVVFLDEHTVEVSSCSVNPTIFFKK